MTEQKQFEEIVTRMVELKDTSELMIDLAYSALMLNSKELAEVVQVEMRQSSKFMKEYKNDKFFEYLKVISDIVEQGQATGIFRNDIVPGIAKRAFFGALDEMSRYWVLSSTKKYDVETAAKEISRLFLNGMGINAPL